MSTTLQVSAVEQQRDTKEEVQAHHGYRKDYEEVIQRHPVNRPAEEVSDFNFMRDIHNHILLSNNRVSNVKDGEDAVDLSFSPTLIVPLKVDESNVYKTRTLLDSGSGTNWISKKVLPFI